MAAVIFAKMKFGMSLWYVPRHLPRVCSDIIDISFFCVYFPVDLEVFYLGHIKNLYTIQCCCK